MYLSNLRHVIFVTPPAIFLSNDERRKLVLHVSCDRVRAISHSEDLLEGRFAPARKSIRADEALPGNSSPQKADKEKNRWEKKESIFYENHPCDTRSSLVVCPIW